MEGCKNRRESRGADEGQTPGSDSKPVATLYQYSASGDYPSKTETGYVHSVYGMVSVTDTGSSYDASTKTFTFAFKWTVALGSFGVYNEYLTLP